EYIKARPTPAPRPTGEKWPCSPEPAHLILFYYFELRQGRLKRSLGSGKFAIFSTFRIDILCALGIIYPVPFGLFSVPAPLFAFSLVAARLWGLFDGGPGGFFFSPPAHSGGGGRPGRLARRGGRTGIGHARTGGGAASGTRQAPNLPLLRQLHHQAQKFVRQS